MKLNFNEYRDKVYACWIGKNIGGTMGTPFEGTCEMLDIQGFTTKEGVILPNDDLDLQLVWFLAVERLGIKAVDAKVLGEYWASFVGPHWNEYGLGKVNMTAGLLPPLSGDAYNTWNNSNGAWIRTEIWATLAPACPDVAVKYAYADACVDHGTKEGTTAAMFVAALESAAFVENNLRKLIGLALRKIPKESRMAKSIEKVLECYDSGMDYREARNVIQQLNADIGNGWFEAPSNVTYAVIGLLWGEGDFKKSMIYAINCGDDTDCTGATVGSILGIMYGTKGIPEDWKRHIGDSIVTVSIKKGTVHPPKFPDTCSELTERVVRIAPTVPVLFNKPIEFTDGPTEVSEADIEAMFAPSRERFPGLVEPGEEKLTDEILTVPAYSYKIDSQFLSATVYFDAEPEIKPLGTATVHLRIKNNVYDYGNMPHNLTIRWLGTEGWGVDGAQFVRLPHVTRHTPKGTVELEYKLTAPEKIDAKNRLVIEISAEARPTVAYVPVTLLGK